MRRLSAALGWSAFGKRPTDVAPISRRSENGRCAGSSGASVTLARVTGEVLQWFADRGFGFIAPDAGGRRVFFHANSVERGVGIHVGDRVEFGTLQEPKGLRAVGVRMVG